MEFEKELKLYGIACGHHIISYIPQWLENIDNLILFGSVAQNRGSPESDIDLFFDTELPEKRRAKLRSDIRKAISDFRLSQEGLKFKMKGMANEVNFSVGKLDEWTSLKRSILSTGAVLYGRYRGQQGKAGLKHHLLIIWEAEGKKRGGFLNKMYGYSVKSKKYRGFVEKCGGTKIGKSAIMAPIEYKDQLFGILEGYKLNYRVIEVFS